MRTRFLLPLAALLFLGAGCSSGSDTGLNARDGAPLSVVPVFVACTQEAKQCPDGSYVARTGPTCEFSACPTSTAKTALSVNMASANFSFSPKTIEAKPGQQVDITFTSNEGFHTIVIDAVNFKQTVESGETVSFTAPTAPGSYPYYCDVGSHRMKGMEGTLIVK